LWKIWQKRRNIDETLQDIAAGIDQLGKRIDRLESRIDGISGDRLQQENKVLRMQYKGTQEILENLEALKSSQYELSGLQEKLLFAEKHKRVMLTCLLNMLDDLDLVTAKLREGADNNWTNLFNSWTKNIIAALQRLGFQEIPLLGQEFNPFYAEALGTVKKEEAVGGASACQVVEVIRRGFLNSDGSLLRKARVITVEEEGRGEGEETATLPAPEDDYTAAPSSGEGEKAIFHQGLAGGKNTRSLERERLPLKKKRGGHTSRLKKKNLSLPWRKHRKENGKYF